MMVTLERLREVLSYNPASGEFAWKAAIRKSAKKIGDKAGYVLRDNGDLEYRVIKIDGRTYMAHRLAWLYVHGLWPAKFIDHINGDGLDNRICNLREAGQTENMCNRRPQKNNTSGYKGVFWHKLHEKWIAKIQVDRRSVHLGYYDDPAVAHEAYCVASKKYHGAFGTTWTPVPSEGPDKRRKASR